MENDELTRRATSASAAQEREEAGQEEGHVCNRSGCSGVIALDESDRNCSCHINPPCGSCTAPREYCPTCDWRATDDDLPFNDFLVRPANPVGAWASWRPRPLDPTKIDWHSKQHSNSSMIKEGVYPQSANVSADRAAVLEKVEGTFGGRFEHFGHGRFKYVAYTD
jgi:hypothetical protein